MNEAELVLAAPEGATSCTHDGVIYEVEDGLVVVPHAALEHLTPHGYTIPEVKAAVETKPQGKKAK